jgi:pseudaminic acid synthase
MDKRIRIGKRYVGEGEKTFVVAEVSANHLQDYGRAEAIIKAAAQAGVDAVKLQTYTPDTITLDCDNDYFQITQGTIWDGTTLHKLYEEAYTPWEWQPRLMEYANGLGLECFSSPFDATAVDFMKEMDMPAYKVASFEINDIPLIRKIAGLGKPVILATGIAYLEDMERALQVCKEEGNEQVVLLKCTSAYPSPYEEMNLKVIPNMAQVFDCITGLSDHSMGTAAAVASVALGAKMVEKHLTLSRADGGPDGAFSMEPDEFKKMVDEIRIVEKALGKVTYELSEKQKRSREDGRSLFVVKNMKEGEIFTEENVRSIRPAFGLHTMYLDEIMGKRARTDISKGTPLDWKLIL